MKFAELTQEVQIARPQEVVFDIGLTPGRRRPKDGSALGKNSRALLGVATRNWNLYFFLAAYIYS